MNMVRKEHITALFSILRNPVDGFEQMRFRMRGSRKLATLLYVLFFIAIVAERQWTGYLFNFARVERLNIFIMAAMALGIPALWVISNIAVCTLTDGEGSLSDIYIVTAYAFLPYILLAPVSIIVSNVLINKEAAYYALLQMFQTGWTVLLLFCGNMTAHQYSFKKAVATVLLTIMGIIIILFLFFLSFVLIQQLVEFIRTIVFEISYM